LVARPLQWSILHKDRLPSYISWEQYERNLHQLQMNNAQGMGAIRQGPSLLSGLLICGRCGRRMAPTYRNSGHSLRYQCNQMATSYGLSRCQSLVGRTLDEFVAQQVLRALEPAALEISLQVADQIEAERAQLQQHWQQRLERAHYEVERAARQYQCVEPEHRLVARTLEHQWEDALSAEAALKADYERFMAEHPGRLSAEQREAIRRLAADIPALWHGACTTAADRQAIVRQLIERVTVTVQGDSEKVDVHIYWAGGHATQGVLTRPVARLDQLSYYAELTARVAALHAQGHTGPGIARLLNEEGWRPAKRCETFNAAMVGALMLRMGLRTRHQTPAMVVQRQSDEWTLGELSHLLDMPQPTLVSWLRRGELQARQVMSQSHRLWLVHATADDLARLRSRRNAAATKTNDEFAI